DGRAGFGLLEHGDDMAVGEAGLLHGTSSGKGTRKFHFWRQLMDEGDYRGDYRSRSGSAVTVADGPRRRHALRRPAILLHPRTSPTAPRRRAPARVRR